MDDNLLTKAELAEKLKYTKRWIDLNRNILPPSFMLGGQPRWRESDIDQWIADGCPKNEPD